MIFVYIILSFLLDGLISNYLNFTISSISYFTTIYTIISFAVSYNYFSNKKKYLLVLLIMGLLFDIVYTNTFPLNVIVFILIGMLVGYLDESLPSNILTINIKSYLSIILYHILSYLILLISHYNSYDLYLLKEILLRSIIMTIIYTTLSYFIIKKINPKKIK